MAVVLVSRPPITVEHQRVTPRTLVLTLAAGAAFALSFVLTAEVPSGSGLAPLVAARATATAVVFTVLLPQVREATRRWGVRQARLPIAIGLVDVLANVSMYYTFQHGQLSLGSVIIALYPAVTVGLAVLVLRERIGRLQSLGLIAAVAAVVLVTQAA